MIKIVLAVCAISGCTGTASPTALVRAWARPPELGESTLAWRFQPDPEMASALQLGAGWGVRNVVGASDSGWALCRGSDGEALSDLASPALKDFDARVRLQPLLGGEETLGLAFRVQGNDRYYLARLNSRTNGLRLYRRDGADWYLLDSRNLSVPVGRWRELDLRAQGDHFAVGLAGEPILQADDESYTVGALGFWIGPGSAGCLGELSAVPLSE
jgi:hypothetical protein